MNNNRCKYANKICNNESLNCKSCETYKIYTENIKYMESYHKLSV
jgi:hypothetical protein